MAESHTRGGTHEPHAKAGEQSHKNTPSTHGSHDKDPSAHGGSGQHASSGASHDSHSTHTGTQGGTHEQHVKAGQQSHKNS